MSSSVEETDNERMRQLCELVDRVTKVLAESGAPVAMQLGALGIVCTSGFLCHVEPIAVAESFFSTLREALKRSMRLQSGKVPAS